MKETPLTCAVWDKLFLKRYEEYRKETPIDEILAQDGEEQPAEPCEETQRGQAQWAEIRKELEEQGKHQHPCGAVPPTCCGIYNRGDVWELLHWDMITPTPVIFCPFCGERLSKI